LKSIRDQLQKPSHESMPWALWHWNLSLTKNRLIEQFEWFVQSGFGGIVVRPSREMEPVYLSEEFYQCFQIILDKAEQHKINIRIADDFSLPWSGCLKNEMAQNPQMRSQRLRLIENRLVSDRQDVAVKTAGVDRCVAVMVREINGIPDPHSATEIQINSSNNLLKWPVQDGTWRVLVFNKEYSADPTGGYIPNVFNHNCSDKYIHQVLEPLRERFSRYIPAIFEGFVNELPSTLPAKNTIPWDDDLIVKFRSKSKKNIIKLLPSLFCDKFPGAQKNRQQIYSFFYESIYERFVVPLEEWAKKNRMSQWVLCPEGANGKTAETLVDGYIPLVNNLSALGFQNMDGVGENDTLLRIMADVNVNQCKRETITVLGRNRTGYGSTLQSLKSDTDRMLLAGTSRILIDGFFGNIDQRSYCKTPIAPGWYAPEGPIVKDLCTYIARSKEFCRNIHWNRQIAILAPFSEIMAAYVPTVDNVSTIAFDRLKKTINALERNGYSYDFVTEHLLSECSIRSNGEFGTADRLRKGNYQALIVPYAPDLSRNALIFIEKLVQREGCVLFVEEIPHGTIEDGVSSTMTTRFEKILAERHKSTGVLSLDAPDEAFKAIVSNITLLQNGKSISDIATAYGLKDGHDVYLFHNKSEVKDQPVAIEVPDRHGFFIGDIEHGDLLEVLPAEKVNNNARFHFVLPPKATVFLIGSSSGNSRDEHSPKNNVLCNPFTIPERSYRILLKDQWTFSTLSLNAYPLSAWNVRIGLSRDSGGFSQFYESHFQIKNLPSTCQLVVNATGLLHGYSVASAGDIPIEIAINGTRVDCTAFATKEADETNKKNAVVPGVKFTEESPIISAMKTTSLVYPISEYLLRGVNRISIRTTGLVFDSGAICYPPVLFGDFMVIKGQNGGVIDKMSEIAMQNSWVKTGFPYLCGKGIYRQSFELPDEYKKLVLCFPNVSGAIEVRMNATDLGRYNWQPMCVDITPACEQKRNELTVSVVNSIDTLLRMNGRPSGIFGDVYLDVY
jgi:hypothetical protein